MLLDDDRNVHFANLVVIRVSGSAFFLHVTFIAESCSQPVLIKSQIKQETPAGREPLQGTRPCSFTLCVRLGVFILLGLCVYVCV